MAEGEGRSLGAAAWGIAVGAMVALMGIDQADAQQPPAERQPEAPAAAPEPPKPPEITPVSVAPPITVIATRGPKPLVETPASVTTILRQEMDRRMMTTIEDMVRYTPGISVNRQTSGTDPFKSLGGFTVRGVGGNRVLTMVDGSRTIERITDQTRDFVDLSNMKRVEIVRGPASALWGSDALGGVVAFTTKDPADYIAPGKSYGFQGDATYASVNDAFTETVTGAVRAGMVEAMLSYTRRDAHEFELDKARSPNGAWPCTRAPESLPCNRLDPSDIGSNNLLGKLVFNISPDNRVKVTGEYFDRLTRVNQLWDHGRPVNTNGTFGTTLTEDYKREQDLQRFRFAVEHEWKVDLPWLEGFKWMAAYHPHRLDRTGRRLQRLPNGQRTLRDDYLRYEEDFYEFDLQMKSSFDLGPSRHQIIYGFDGGYTTTDYKRKDVTTNLTTGAVTTAVAGGFNFANARTTRADWYIQDEISFLDRRILITPGFRVATYRIKPELGPGYQIVPGAEPQDIYKTDIAPKLGIVGKLTQNYSIYAQYAEGFKMPTAEQLYTSVPNAGGPGSSLIPNPNLKPESVKSYEIGVRGEFQRGFFSANVFYARYKDFIQSFVFLPNGDITYDNISRVNIWGVEANGAWQVHPNWELSAAMSWQRGDQNDNGVKAHFNGAEPYKMVAGVRFVKPEWGLDVDLVGTYQRGMKRTDDTISPRFKSDAYAMLDLITSWEPWPGITVRGAVLNIFDKRYFLPATAVGYTETPGTAAIAATNPIELQTQPGRTYKIGLTARF